MKDKDTQLIWESYLTENSEEEHYYNLGRDAALAGKDLRDINASDTYGPMSYTFERGFRDANKKTYEFKVTWPGIRMRAHSRSFDIKSSDEPTEEELMQFVANKIKEGWSEHGVILSDGDKKDIKDPMTYTISHGPVAYGDDEDRGAIGFKRGGRPLHGG